MTIASSINRRAVLALLGAAVSPLSQAQAFPSRPLKIVVPFGAGGVADLTARTIGQKLSESLGQPVVVENKPGAGGIGASDMVAKSAPDGYTLLLMSNASAVSAGLFKSLPYDTVRDFIPISTLGYFDIAIVTAGDSKFKTLGDLLAYARANPGKLNLGSINIGSTQNLAAELFKARAGVDLQIIPFNRTPDVVTALRGGQIDAAVEIMAPVMGQIRAGALRALAVTGEARSPLLPEVPTAGESGVRDFVASSWNALAAPARTPPEVIARLNHDIQAAVNAPAVSAKLRSLNVDARSCSPGDAAKLLASEIKRWGDVIVSARIPRL